VTELVTGSYRLIAPKRLAALAAVSRDWSENVTMSASPAATLKHRFRARVLPLSGYRRH